MAQGNPDSWKRSPPSAAFLLLATELTLYLSHLWEPAMGRAAALALLPGQSLWLEALNHATHAFVFFPEFCNPLPST